MAYVMWAKEKTKAETLCKSRAFRLKKFCKKNVCAYIIAYVRSLRLTQEPIGTWWNVAVFDRLRKERRR